MDRREFNLGMLTAMGAILIEPSLLHARPKLQVNGKRLSERLSKLAEFGKNPQGGVSRVAYSDFDRQGREYVMGLMRTAKLETSIDAAGNIIGRRAGTQPNLPPLLTGSHIDTVPEGGNYDGCMGSISAIEVAQTLTDNKVTTRHPLEFIIFQNEEGGLFGSHALIGDLKESDLDLVSLSGKTIRDGITFIGGNPSKLASVKRKPGDIAAYLEYHIEQGPVLDADKINIGVVEGIVGVNRWDVTIEGFANHAGATPMNRRKDALLTAARFIEMVNRVVTGVPGLQVGTVGRINALPGAVNVIAGKVNLSLDLRDLEASKIEMLYQKIYAEAQQIAKINGTTFQFKETDKQVPALTDPRIRQFIVEAAKEFGLTTKSVRSGAGHDAQAVARIAPIGMIFIPSVGGISHSPQEYSHPDDITNGANVHLCTLLKLDDIK
jgi:N-carbamoyl-L-amino-acid hydrolase